LPADRLVTEFSRLLDDEAGSVNPQDDVTIVVMEIEERSPDRGST
jgi:hypothetical protein